MPDIAFMTYVHNGEKTMRRSIESVLGQENVDLVYYLINNASTDSTWDIMREYEAKDNRVKLIQNENSLVRIPEYIKSIEDCEYFAVLDADDEYEPAFARETISFIEREDLDISAVGICFCSSSHKEYRKEEYPVVWVQDEYKERIELFSKYFIGMWGSVYKLAIVQQMDFSTFQMLAQRGLFLGVDTIFCISAVEKSHRIGIHNRTLIKNNIAPGTDSNRYSPNRFLGLVAIIERYLKLFVNSKEMNQVDEKNLVHIMKMYYSFLMGTIEKLIPAEMEIERFFRELKVIIDFSLTPICMQHRPDTKEWLVMQMINKMQGMENNQEAVNLFFECLKGLDAEGLFQELAKGKA